MRDLPRRLLAITFVVVVAFACVDQALGAPVPESLPSTSVAVTLRLDRPTRRAVETEMIVRTPLVGSARHAFARMRAIRARGSTRYAWAVHHVLRLSGVLDPYAARSLVGALGELPAVRIADGFATIRVRAPQWGPWRIDGDEIRLTTPTLPRGVTFTARIVLVRGSIVATRPLPARQRSARDVAWTFTGGTKATVHATLASPMYDEGVDYARALSSLTAGLPFLLLLLGWPAARRLPRPPRRLVATGVALTLGVVAYGLLISVFARELPFLGGVDNPESVRNALLVALPGVAVTMAIGLPWPRPLAVLATGFALCVLVAFGVATIGAQDIMLRYQPVEHGDGPLARTYAIGGVVTGTMLVVCASVAVWRWIVTAARPVVALQRNRAIVILVAVVIGVTVMAQVLLSSSARTDSYHVLSIDQEFLWSSQLGFTVSSLQGLPYILASLLLPLLAVALVVWLGVELWLCSGEGEPDLQSLTVSGAAGLMFAMALVGLGGRIGEVAVPLAFLIAVPLIVVALRRAARRPRARLHGLASVRGRAHELLVLAEEVAAIDATKPTERAARRADLLSRTNLPELDREAQEGDLVELGLYAGAGARARARDLARHGWWIIAVPVLYGTFILLRDSAPGSVAAEQSYGLPFLLLRLVLQLVAWPAVAWFFVVAAPAIPGRNGAIKGAVAATAYAAPALLAMWILGDNQDGTNALFTAAELVLFFVAIGLWHDLRTVRRASLEPRALGTLYHLTSVRAVTAYAAPAALVLFTVVHGLANGKGASALGDLVANAPSLLPGNR